MHTDLSFSFWAFLLPRKAQCSFSFLLSRMVLWCPWIGDCNRLGGLVHSWAKTSPPKIWTPCPAPCHPLPLSVPPPGGDSPFFNLLFGWGTIVHTRFKELIFCCWLSCTVCVPAQRGLATAVGPSPHALSDRKVLHTRSYLPTAWWFDGLISPPNPYVWRPSLTRSSPGGWGLWGEPSWLSWEGYSFGPGGFAGLQSRQMHPELLEGALPGSMMAGSVHFAVPATGRWC